MSTDDEARMSDELKADGQNIAYWPNAFWNILLHAIVRTRQHFQELAARSSLLLLRCHYLSAGTIEPAADR